MHRMVFLTCCRRATYRRYCAAQSLVRLAPVCTTSYWRAARDPRVAPEPIRRIFSCLVNLDDIEALPTAQQQSVDIPGSYLPARDM